MKIVSAAEMRQIDRVTSERFGVPSLTLMENAGAAVARVALERYPDAQRITILCGKGNNGGDGFVAARKLLEAGREVRVLLLAEASQLTGDAAEMFRRMPMQALAVPTSASLQTDSATQALRADLFVDAILGTGFKPPVAGVYAEAIALLNRSTSPVIAVDIPSGADADGISQTAELVARADAIVTFTAPRPAHVFSLMTQGPTTIAPIGSPDQAIASELMLNLTTAREVLSLLPPRPADSNKGTYGACADHRWLRRQGGRCCYVRYGGPAGRRGIGHRSHASVSFADGRRFRSRAHDRSSGGHERRHHRHAVFEFGLVDRLTEGKRAIAIGPGLGAHMETHEFVRTCVERYRGPLILDADALNAFQGTTERVTGHGRSVILTPHPGEMARLISRTVAEVQSDRLGCARSFASEHGVIVVLKGHRTLIVHPDGTAWVNPTGNPGMATGGTGDILTGMIAGLVAQHAAEGPERVFDAVVAAVFLHGIAGDAARDVVGEYSLTATDLLRFLPAAFRRITEDAKVAAVEIGR